MFDIGLLGEFNFQDIHVNNGVFKVSAIVTCSSHKLLYLLNFCTKKNCSVNLTPQDIYQNFTAAIPPTPPKKLIHVNNGVFKVCAIVTCSSHKLLLLPFKFL